MDYLAGKGQCYSLPIGSSLLRIAVASICFTLSLISPKVVVGQSCLACVCLINFNFYQIPFCEFVDG